ncbi:kynurenine 3-monooxygenase and related flavoprotein monooxygenase [Chrysochromulina tobinii]|uniref:Kynurenine 3-monooxygenase and related flavoprotein monooxygenase n=1 Tax=Chrysochromulina tobinii TaxID=1460289 RepID=A0A0M0JQW3_9EUKA|nr:kynurenine 3-monooxygenase and related flavoprotein monooxygenase [Chrysochromulina tobinii]|eukprot:KOO28974.1 kynurenine 3-monooxygenase and related flavoprotein monooxygenase [Chrysochromulina sp. CCMP291]
MNSVNCATALHRLARGGGASSAVEQSLCTITASTFEHEAGGVTARSLTSVAWAVGKLRLSDKRLLAALTARAAAQLAADALDAFGIANVAWALATLHTAAMSATTRTVGLDDECGGGLCDALAVAACARASDFKPQELTNLVWAFATLKWRHARLFEQLADVASARLAEFSPQGLSQTLWAYSKLGLTKHGLFGAVANAALPRLGSFDPQSIATLAWAFANLEIEHAPLAAAVCREARARPDAFDSASCTQLLWGLCRLRDGVEPLSVVALSRRLERVAAAGLAPQQLVCLRTWRLDG